MRAREPVPEALRDAPFGYRAGLDDVGRGTLRGPSFRRMARGAYCFVGLDVDVDLQVRAARAVLPPFAVLTGQSAAWALGSRWWRPDVVEVAVPVGRRVRSRPGIVVRERRLSPADIVMTDLGPATSPARTAFDLARSMNLDPRLASTISTAVALARQFDADTRTQLARHYDADTCAELARAAGAAVAPSPAGIWVPTLATADTRSLIAAVSQVDAVLHATGCGPVGVLELLERRPRPGRAGLVAAVLALCDPRAESPPDSELRVRCVLAGLPWPTPQYVLRDAGGAFVARLDLGWPHCRVGSEYDGALHRQRDRHSSDLQRHNGIRMQGWTVLQVDAAQLRRPHLLLTRLHQLVAPPLGSGTVR